MPAKELKVNTWQNVVLKFPSEGCKLMVSTYVMECRTVVNKK